MLRASKKITITTDSLECDNGFILSTIIDLNGLILRADQPLAKPIKNFLIAKNVQVSRVRINYQAHNQTSDNYEYYVRIYGKFTITKSEIIEFIANNEELIKAQKEKLDEIPSANKMQISIKMHYDWCCKKVNYTDKKHIWSGFSGGIFSGEQFVINSKKMDLTQPISAGQLVNINTEQFVTQGALLSISEDAEDKPRIINAGLMTPLFSLKTIEANVKKDLYLTNSVMAAEDITIVTTDQGSKVRLTIDTKIDWLNNPYYADFFDLFGTENSNITMCQVESVGEKSELKRIVQMIPRVKC